jgi:hypothetical protein
MDKDKETEQTEEKKLRDLTPEKDAKGGAKSPSPQPLPLIHPAPTHHAPIDPPTPTGDTGARQKLS